MVFNCIFKLGDRLQIFIKTEGVRLKIFKIWVRGAPLGPNGRYSYEYSIQWRNQDLAQEGGKPLSVIISEKKIIIKLLKIF